jgi:hypothetical protein
MRGIGCMIVMRGFITSKTTEVQRISERLLGSYMNDLRLIRINLK